MSGYELESEKRMAKGIHRLSKSKVNFIKEPGKYHDGGGLTFNVRQSGSRNWTFRYNYNKRRREMGLGSFSTTDIDTARARAKRMRDMLFEGKDPIEEMKQSRSKEAQRILARKNQKTFRDACESAINSKIPT